jgi:hypothetical protein
MSLVSQIQHEMVEAFRSYTMLKGPLQVSALSLAGVTTLVAHRVFNQAVQEFRVSSLPLVQKTNKLADAIFWYGALSALASMSLGVYFEVCAIDLLVKKMLWGAGVLLSGLLYFFYQAISHSLQARKLANFNVARGEELILELIILYEHRIISREQALQVCVELASQAERKNLRFNPPPLDAHTKGVVEALEKIRMGTLFDLLSTSEPSNVGENQQRAIIPFGERRQAQIFQGTDSKNLLSLQPETLIKQLKRSCDVRTISQREALQIFTREVFKSFKANNPKFLRRPLAYQKEIHETHEALARIRARQLFDKKPIRMPSHFMSSQNLAKAYRNALPWIYQETAGSFQKIARSGIVSIQDLRCAQDKALIEKLEVLYRKRVISKQEALRIFTARTLKKVFHCFLKFHHKPSKYQQAINAAYESLARIQRKELFDNHPVRMPADFKWSREIARLYGDLLPPMVLRLQ